MMAKSRSRINLDARHVNGMTHFDFAVDGKLEKIHVRLFDTPKYYYCGHRVRNWIHMSTLLPRILLSWHFKIIESDSITLLPSNKNIQLAKKAGNIKKILLPKLCANTFFLLWYVIAKRLSS